jgi:Putative zinc-finger
MCFDGKTLSSYVDGELNHHQTFIIQEHLENCSTCRTETNRYSLIINQIKESRENYDSFTKEAIWTRLAHSTSTDKVLGFLHRRLVLSPSIMISLSFLFIAAIGISIYSTVPKNTNLIYQSNKYAFDTGKFPLEIPIDNVEKILKYFDIHDEPMEVFIELPGPSGFVIQGEPRFLKKNDYIAGR